MDGPSILVGHSYGGAVITSRATTVKVVGSSMSRRSCRMSGDRRSGLRIPRSGASAAVRYRRRRVPPSSTRCAYVESSGFADALPDGRCRVHVADSQVPISLRPAARTPLTVAACKDKPSLVPAGQGRPGHPARRPRRHMAGRAKERPMQEEIEGSHLAFIAQGMRPWAAERIENVRRRRPGR